MSETGKIIMSWWANALERETTGGRGLSARQLRASAVEVLCETEVHELSRALKTKNADKLVRVACLLAEVREHTNQTLPRILGGSEPNEPKLSPLRFQRLMRAEGDDLTNGLRRAIHMADHRCNVATLGEDLMFWNEKTRRNWCFQYFRSEAPQSSAKPDVEETDQ